MYAVTMKSKSEVLKAVKKLSKEIGALEVLIFDAEKD